MTPTTTLNPDHVPDRSKSTLDAFTKTIGFTPLRRRKRRNALGRSSSQPRRLNIHYRATASNSPTCWQTEQRSRIVRW